MLRQYVANTLLLALTGIWVALLLACAPFPAYLILGTSAQITVSSILLSGMTAPLLGPLWGALAGFVFGWMVPYANPGASMGILTFLGPTMTAMMGGLFLFGRWKEATAMLALQIVIWFAHPFAWYEMMPLITWQFLPVFVFMVVPPVRKWIVSSIVTRNPKHLTAALWCLAWIGRIGGDVATSNNNAVWILGWGVPNMYQFWAPLTLYYAIADSLNGIAAAIIGTAVLITLKKANIRLPVLDSLEKKK
jgi:hypothetical protein